MASVQVLILRSGRADVYGLPFIPGSVATVDRDYAASLVSTGFASWMNPADAYDGETNIRKPSEAYTIFTAGAAFGLLPGDGGANGLTFTDSIGNFTLSAAVITDFYRAFAGGGYIYFPAGTAGSLDGWYFAVMFSDTAGRVYADKYLQGTGTPQIVASPTSLSGISTGRITQSTSEITAFTFTLPGGGMGPNGRFISEYARAADATGTKTVRTRLAGIAIYSDSKTTSSVGESTVEFRNIGSQNRQWGDRGSFSATIASSQYSSIDTSVDETLTVTLQSSLNTIGQFVGAYIASITYGA